MIKAVYPGTFDPMTHGHLDVVRRASKIFGHVTLAVALNPKKKPLLDLETRVRLAREVCAEFPNVDVVGFDGLLKTLIRDVGANVIVRGARAVSDFDYEFQMAGMNRRLMPDVETVFMLPSDKYQFVTGTFIREIASMEIDEVEGFVPAPVYKALRERFGGK